jgi:uncharacterized membrane protein (UPF0127 family)
MKKLFLIALPLLVIGCQKEASAPAASSAPGDTSSAPLEAGFNPDRINQLKDLKTVSIEAPKGTMKLWIMDTPSARQEGMMFLVDREVKDDEGMIFVFPEIQKDDGKHGFWMHNTILPLDLAYVGKDKKIVSIGKGAPHDDTMINPKGDYIYVIELKLGMAERLGLKPGMSVNIPDSVRTDQ